MVSVQGNYSGSPSEGSPISIIFSTAIVFSAAIVFFIL